MTRLPAHGLRSDPAGLGVRCACWLLLFALVAATPCAVEAGEAVRDVDPAPPWIFFPEPDPQTAHEIHRVINTSFADANKVITARETLVRRFGVWSAPELGRVLAAAPGVPRHESRTWNAALTVYALRDRVGNARELWPLIHPLTQLLDDRGVEPYRRAFAALALGSFHGPTFAPAPPRHKDPLVVRLPEEMVRRDLGEAVAALGRSVFAPDNHLKVAVALALAKSGARNARSLLCVKACLSRFTTVESRQAMLLGIGLLPGQDDEHLLVQALGDNERRIRRAAALGVALQALGDHPPGWVGFPRSLLRALTSSEIRMDLEDGAETTFARGVLAALGPAASEWRTLFEMAAQRLTEESTAVAAAQCVLFCPEPWAHDQVVAAMERPLGGALPKTEVIAAFLLHLGSQGEARDIDICRKFLGNNARSPKGKARVDVRYYAVIGLFRALAAGRVDDPALRAQIVDAFDQAVKRGLHDGPFRQTLARVLEGERRRVLEDPHYSVPGTRIQELERSFVDPYAFLARDLRDVAVARLNAMVPLVFNVNPRRSTAPGEPDRTQQPQRFLMACLQHFPYFSRLDLRSDRGLRPPTEMSRGGNPQQEVRRP